MHIELTKTMAQQFNYFKFLSLQIFLSVPNAPSSPITTDFHKLLMPSLLKCLKYLSNTLKTMLRYQSYSKIKTKKKHSTNFSMFRAMFYQCFMNFILSCFVQETRKKNPNIYYIKEAKI